MSTVPDQEALARGVSRPITGGLPEVEFLPHQHTPCMARLDAHRSWHRTIAVTVASRGVGIRVSDEAAGAGVERLFRASRVPGADTSAPPNFSVEMARDIGGAGERGLHLVYRDHQVIARRRDPEQILLDLAELVSATGLDQERACLAVRGSALMGSDPDGTRFVTMVPAAWHRALMLRRSWLLARGLRLLAATVHLVDGDGRVQVPARDASPAGVRPTPLRRWGVRSESAGARSVRHAQAVHLAFSSVVNVAAMGPASVLRELREVTGVAEVVALDGEGAAAWPRTAVGLARAEAGRVASSTRPAPG